MWSDLFHYFQQWSKLLHKIGLQCPDLLVGNGIRKREPLHQSGHAQFEALFPDNSVFITDDKFVAPSPDIQDHHMGMIKGNCLPYSFVNQFCLTVAGDHPDPETKFPVYLFDKLLSIVCISDGRSGKGPDIVYLIASNGLHVVLNGHEAAFKCVGGNAFYLDTTFPKLYGLFAGMEDFECSLLSFSNQEVKGVGAEIENRCYHELYLSHFQTSL